MNAEELEASTRRIGHEIFERVREASQTFSLSGWLDEKLMSWGMGDEQLKLQLFRFVDALPVLKETRQVTKHLWDYYAEAEPHLGAGLRTLARWTPKGGMIDAWIAKFARFSATRMARKFIAAASIEEACDMVEALRRDRLAFTIDVLGEAVLSNREALHYQAIYLRMIDALADRLARLPGDGLIDRDDLGPIPRLNVSIKISGLFSQFDPIDPAGTSRGVRDRLRPILRLAKKRGALVNVDMEQFAYKDVTLQIFREILEEDEFRGWSDVGIAIQAYLTSCGEDLRQLANWAQSRGTSVWVRLVKGAYWDFETVIAQQNGWAVPVFTDKAQTDANYELQTRFLLENRKFLRPAIASHNIRSISWAMALAKDMDMPPGAMEFQMLHGMAEPLKTALVRMGQRVRVYTPMGELLPGMAYLVRRLLENTSNESFLRAGFLEHVPEEQLLMNPKDAVKKPHPAAEPARGQTAAGALPKFGNEPIVDFSQAPARKLMVDALERVRGQMGKDHPLVIGGREVMSKKFIESVNPSHRKQLVGRAPAGGVAEAKAAVDAAERAAPAWRATPAPKRAAFLRAVAEILRREKFTLSAWEVFESGKPWREADADVAEAIDFCDYYADEMLRLAAPLKRNVAGEDNEYFYEPRGITVVIAPWNFPLAILCGMTMAALVCGNTVVMKPAEQSPVIAAKLMDAIREAGKAHGVPDGACNLLFGVGEEIGPALVEDPRVAVIAFTGSRNVGLAINASAAKTPPGQNHVKKVIAEMGGKNAVIVDDDADLDEAVHGVLASAFGFAGQKCSACSRAVVLAPIYDAFVARLAEAASSVRVGPADDPQHSVGPVIDAEAQQRINGMIERARKESRLAAAVDVSAIADEGFYVPPTVFVDVDPGAAIAREEVFGPVLAVIKAKDLDDALRIANDSVYALTGGVYSRSPANVDRVRREFRVGNLYINRKITGALVDRQPFGGFGLSGVGSKAGGPDYLQQFLVPRVVTENTLRRGFAPVDAPEPAGMRGGE